MHTNYFEHWPQLGKDSFEPWMEMNGITSRTMSELTRANLEAINEWMQCFSEHTHNLSRAKGIEEMMSLQTGFTSKIARDMCQCTQQNIEAIMQGMTECKKCFEKGWGEFSKEKKSSEKGQHFSQHHKS